MLALSVQISVAGVLVTSFPCVIASSTLSRPCWHCEFNSQLQGF
jgi:hypothetical protein